MMTDDEVIRRSTRGTTTQPYEIKILYNDGRKALIKHPGSKGGGSVYREWRSSWVVLHDLENPRVMLGVWSGKTVWDCSRDADGPLTRKRLIGLVEKLGLDPLAIRIPDPQPK